MKEAGFNVAPWVDEMLAAGNTNHFTKLKMESGCTTTLASKHYKAIPGGECIYYTE